MIAVDTSALIEILLAQPDAGRCLRALAAENEILISAGTMAEALIVASRRGLGAEMRRFFDEITLEVVPVDDESAKRAADAYNLWGKGVHPAKLNYGDCFAYELAKTYDCPLLFVGSDFSQTDIRPAV